MPPRFGNIAKAYIVQDSQIDPSATTDEVSNGNRIFSCFFINPHFLRVPLSNRSESAIIQLLHNLKIEI